MNLQDRKGITLVALAVTITVLIILATISINGIIGENGLAEQAKKIEKIQEDKISNREAQTNEIEGKYENTMTSTTIPSNPSTGPNGKPLVTVLTARQTNTVIAEDELGKQVVVPANFKVRADLAKKVDEGIVIEDKLGNQFVWVPCTTTGEEGLISYAQDKQYNDGTTSNNQNNYIKYLDWTDVGNITSVEKYKGFYVARYEAGIPESANFYADKSGDTYYTATTTTSKNVTTYIPVSKPGVPCWNHINQENAVIVSANMYQNSMSVDSSLIDSYAWDTIVNWIASSGLSVVDSTNYGNYKDSTLTSDGLYAEHVYSGTKLTTPATNYQKGNITLGRVEESSGEYIYKEIATGTAKETKVKNIYDMAGNMWEWTTETGYHKQSDGTVRSAKYSTLRGGSFYSGWYGAISNRDGGVLATAAGNPNVGFRVVLYIK